MDGGRQRRATAVPTANPQPRRRMAHLPLAFPGAVVSVAQMWLDHLWPEPDSPDMDRWLVCRSGTKV